MHAHRLAIALVLVLGLAGCGSDQDTVMPDVTGQRLDIALSNIKRAGIEDKVEVLGGGVLGVIDKSNWQVCDQAPAARQEVTAAPRLTVDRSCGDGAPEPTTPPAASLEASATPSEIPSAAAASPSASPSTAKSGTAVAALAAMRIAGRGSMTGYDRDMFGPAWADTNRNGCDTRNDVLKAQLVSATFAPGTAGCKVMSGVRHDPYTGTDIRFVYGGASELDIDHVVALGNAWVTGAARWPYAKQIALANDPLNLLAVSSSANRQKGDGDAATWLPANKGYRCAYVARQVSVKVKYGLYLTPPEKAAISRVLASCPGEKVVRGGNPTTSTATPPRPGTAPKPKPKPKPSATKPSGGGTDPRFGTCGAANDAGYGPYYRGKDVEYGWYIDRDRDGIDCEP